MRLKLKIPPKAQGICYIIMAAFGFSCMSLFVRLAGQLPPFQKAFFRNLFALIFMFAVLLRQKVGFRPNKGSVPGLIGRRFFGTVGPLCNFYDIGQLNLSDANMLNKLSPFFLFCFRPCVQGKTKFGLRLHAGNFCRRFGLFGVWRIAGRL